MNTKIKNYIGVAIIIALLVVSFTALSYVRAYQTTTGRSFYVSGEGEVVAIPDVAQFSFSIITQGGLDTTDLQTKNTEKVNAAIDYLKSKEVDKKDIKTQNYSVEPRYQYYDCSYRGGGEVCPPPEIVGYTIRQTVVVKIRDLESTGDILKGVVERGANNVSQLSFVIDDPTVVENEARARAIEQAKAKAKAIAKAGGFRVGKILEINESGSGYLPYRAVMSDMAKGVGGEAAPAPMIEPGSQDITINVNIKYEIK